MAAAYISPAAEGAKPSAAQPRHSGVRKTLENLIHLIFLLCGVVAVAFVLLISIYLILSGIPAIREIGLGKFLFGKVWDPTNTTTGAQYGILAFILTSIYGTAGAILIGVPVGLLTAVFLARVAPPRLAAVIRTAVQLLAGIPSVVYGLVGMIVLVPAIQKTFSLSSGACLLAAILVLAVMILPSIINVSETALRAVPHEYEEASLALGATEMETSFRVDDDGDAVEGDNGLGQAAGLLLVLEGTGGKTDVRAAVAGGLNAGAGAGGVVGDAHTAVVGHELLAQRADDLFHRGRAVGRDAAAERGLLRLVVIGVVGGSGLAAAACEQREAHHSGEHKCKCLFHLSFLISHVGFGLSSFHNAKHNGAL